MEIGQRVRYIRVDNEYDKKTGYYPPIGTYGTVVGKYPTDLLVQWDSDTKGDGEWFCAIEDVEEIFHYLVEVLIGHYRFSRECSNADEVYDVLCDIFLELDSIKKEYVDYRKILAEMESGERISYNECPIAICRINGECK